MRRLKSVDLVLATRAYARSAEKRHGASLISCAVTASDAIPSATPMRGVKNTISLISFCLQLNQQLLLAQRHAMTMLQKPSEMVCRFWVISKS